MKTIRNAWNPTITEIRDWAYSDDSSEPCKDWHYSLRIGGYIQLYLDLVADRACLKRIIFLDVLYDTVRCWLGENPSVPVVQVSLAEIATKARRTGCYYLMQFAEDVDAARTARENYDLEFWFEGGYRCRLQQEA
jgi:hypothetical protein